jgi:hypothetical protein
MDSNPNNVLARAKVTAELPSPWLFLFYAKIFISCLKSDIFAALK